MKIRVVGSAGANNPVDDVLEIEDEAGIDEIYQEAREFAIEVTGFEFCVFVLADGKEIPPEEYCHLESEREDRASQLVNFLLEPFSGTAEDWMYRFRDARKMARQLKEPTGE